MEVPGVRGLAALGAAASLVLAGATAAATTVDGAAVPPEQVVRYDLAPGMRSRGSDASSWTAGVLGAWRVEGGTVVYWAVRPEGREGSWDAQDAAVYPAGLTEPASVGTVGLHVPGVDKVFFPRKDGAQCLCSGGYGESLEAGATGVLYAVFPEVPADAATVDVDVSGNNDWVHGVPVQEGLPGPQVQRRTVVWGEGFPAVPEPVPGRIGVEEAAHPSMRKIFASIEQADGERVDTRSDDFTMVELSAEVLFARNQHELSASAGAVVAEVAREIEESGASEVTVVGHTDSRGSDADNQALSERRADSVAKALGERLPGVEITAEGRGEKEPTDTNATEDGMARNRRVAVSFVGEEGR